VVERVDLGLQLGQGVGQRLFVQVAEQRLVKAFVLALGGWLVGLARDRFHAKRLGVFDELADTAAARRVESGPVVGEQSLGYSMSRNRLVKHGDRGVGGLARRYVGAHGVARMIIYELQDDAPASTGEDVFGAVELPARIRRGVDEPPPRRAGLLSRLMASHTGLAEDPCQRCCRGDQLEAH